MQDYSNDRPRQTYDVSGLNINCETCGAQITELPFEPTKRDDGTYGRLYCRECNAKRPKKRFNRDFGNRRRFDN
ncbi:MAG: hypothetical protein AB1721_02525 [Patescibacteria group bacterium]